MKLLLFFIYTAIIGQCTISTNAQWNVQTGGSPTNGGFFVTGASGTNYSLQNAAQFTATDAVTNGTTTITSATATFTANIVGNGCYISGGSAPITADWYEVVTFTDATTITVDRNTGLAAGTGATINCGGALDFPSTAISTAKGHNIWIKTATYGEPDTTIVDATLNQIITGYNTTQGDCTLVTCANRPLIAMTFDNKILWQVGGSLTNGLMQVKNIRFSNVASVRQWGFNAQSARASMRIENCQFDGFTVAIHGDFTIDWNWQWLELFSVEIKNSTSSGIFNKGQGSGGAPIICNSCYIHNNTTHGIDVSAGPGVYLKNSIISNNGGHGVAVSSGTIDFFVAINSDFVSNTNAGVEISNGVGCVNSTFRYCIQLINSIFYGNNTYGVNMQVDPVIIANYFNAYGANTTANRNNFSAGLGDVTLSSNPFTSGTDFSITASSLKGTGYPGVLVTSTGYNSIGAILPNAASTSATIGIPTGN